VRGLDYYRHTAFEFVTDRLGAQGAVIAGGRYDGLTESLGGPHTPAIGWAAGIERLAMMIDHPGVEILDATVIPLGEAALKKATEVLSALRNCGIHSDMAFRGNAKKRLQRAASAGASFAILIGDDELARGEASVKQLDTGEQVNVSFGELADHLLKALNPYRGMNREEFNFVGNVLPE
jgi:histidyl-tRNA synthetase